MLWQAAYAELFFIDTLWPDFTDKQFNEALEWFSKRDRRFGSAASF
jgi:undecaprenyl diphosphate synthase